MMNRYKLDKCITLVHVHIKINGYLCVNKIQAQSIKIILSSTDLS